jgi:hypothetical protein
MFAPMRGSATRRPVAPDQHLYGSEQSLVNPHRSHVSLQCISRMG